MIMHVTVPCTSIHCRKNVTPCPLQLMQTHVMTLIECYLLYYVILKGACLADIDDEVGDLVCVSSALGGDDIVTIGKNLACVARGKAGGDLRPCLHCLNIIWL